MELLPIALVIGFVMWRAKKRRGEVAPPSEVGAVGWTAGIDWSVIPPLARADARRFLRQPAFLVGVALTPLMLRAATGGEKDWWYLSTSMALALVPLGWMTIVATNLLVLQPRRTGADDLMAAAPAPQPVRTGALLLCAVPAVAVASLLAAAWLAVTSVAVGDTFGSPRLAEIGAGVLVVAGSVAVGVAVARWLPHVAFGVLAVFAVSFIQARFMDPSTWPWNVSAAHPGRFLGFLAEPTSPGIPELETRPAGWHLVYLAGLVLVVAVVALARDGLPRRLGALLAAAVVVTVAAGWVQTRPPSEQGVAAMVDYLTNPRDHQTCTEVGSTSICAYRDQQGRPPTGRSGSGRSGPYFLRGSPPPNWRSPTGSRPSPGTATARMCPTSTGFTRPSPPGSRPTRSGLTTGPFIPEPTSSPAVGSRCRSCSPRCRSARGPSGSRPAPMASMSGAPAPGGQARAAVALWLAAVATPDSASTLRELADEHPSGMLTFEDWDEPPMLGVTFAAADVELALSLLALPAELVASTVAAEWATLTSPATGASAVGELFDVRSKGATLDRGPDACR